MCYLLQTNNSNQNFFKEANYIKQICKYFDLNNSASTNSSSLTNDQTATTNQTWNLQKTTNLNQTTDQINK